MTTVVHAGKDVTIEICWIDEDGKVLKRERVSFADGRPAMTSAAVLESEERCRQMARGPEEGGDHRLGAAMAGILATTLGGQPR